MHIIDKTFLFITPRRLLSVENYFDWEYGNGVKILEIFKKLGISLIGKKVLEVGCGYGGIMQYLTDHGVSCEGIDLSASRIDWIKKNKPALAVTCKDVNDLVTEQVRYDIILFPDVIEHVHDFTKVLSSIKNILADNGILYVSFPPFKAPIGGHLKPPVNYIPYFHLLPQWLVRFYLRCIENYYNPLVREVIIDGGYRSLNRITIEAFKRCVRDNNMKIFSEITYIAFPWRLPFIQQLIKPLLAKKANDYFTGTYTALMRKIP